MSTTWASLSGLTLIAFTCAPLDQRFSGPSLLSLSFLLFAMCVCGVQAHATVLVALLKLLDCVCWFRSINGLKKNLSLQQQEDLHLVPVSMPAVLTASFPVISSQVLSGILHM